MAIEHFVFHFVSCFLKILYLNIATMFLQRMRSGAIVDSRKGQVVSLKAGYVLYHKRKLRLVAVAPISRSTNSICFRMISEMPAHEYCVAGQLKHSSFLCAIDISCFQTA
jgi:hypothetical protein